MHNTIKAGITIFLIMVHITTTPESIFVFHSGHQYTVFAQELSYVPVMREDIAMGYYVCIEIDDPVTCMVGSTTSNPQTGNYKLNLRYLHMIEVVSIIFRKLVLGL